MPRKYLVTTTSFYEVDLSPEEMEPAVREALGDLANGEEDKFTLRDLSIEEISTFPGEGGAE